jgi:hypothetical protein
LEGIRSLVEAYIAYRSPRYFTKYQTYAWPLADLMKTKMLFLFILTLLVSGNTHLIPVIGMVKILSHVHSEINLTTLLGEKIWGRGSSDDKGGLIGILASVETLIEQGFVPTRPIVLAFGFDEECSGSQVNIYLFEFPRNVGPAY